MELNSGREDEKKKEAQAEEEAGLRCFQALFDAWKA